MSKYLLLACSFLFLSAAAFPNDYDKAWEALNENKRKLAVEYLQQAMNDPSTAVDAYLTYIYLKSFEGSRTEIADLNDRLVQKVKDANPYLFALWFNDAALGDYGKKTKSYQLKLLDRILKEPQFNGSLRSAAHYVRGMHFLFSNEFQKAESEWTQMGSITNWQLAGPFENLSGSGFYKSFGPLEHPEADASFKSLNNAAISWFTPSRMNDDGWVFLEPHFGYTTAVVYAQSFVYAPTDMKVVLNSGVNGSLKIWVNDAPVISESRERVTELDCYKSYCQLKKGYNRILVQVGFTANSIPNFIIRLTDENFNPIPGLTYKAEPQSYVKQASGEISSNTIRHFAEVYFENKIKEQPDNLVNYILLSQTYLRNKKTYEARKIIQEAIAKDPENSLLRYELMQCYLKENNRTLLSQEIERIKDKDSGCYLVYLLNLSNLMDEEKYDDAINTLNEIESIYGEDEETINRRIKISVAQDKTEEAVKLVQKGYEKYPDNVGFVQMMYNLKKNANKDVNAAFSVYEKFLKNNFNFGILKDLGQEYVKNGKREKGMDILNKLVERYSYDAELLTDMVKFYYDEQNYNKAAVYADLVLKLSPYVATYWDNKAIVLDQLGKAQEAMDCYSKAIYYDSKRYESRKKLRALQKKSDLYKSFPETDVYDLIKKSAGKTISNDYGYYYLLDEKLTILYTEGAVEDYTTMVIKINTEKGIDTWKESYIPYNDNTQSLLIQKSEVVKKNGNKVTADQNNSDLVFTSLEVGDAIVIKYRIQNFAAGRMAKEFWDRYLFDAFVPSDLDRYCLLVDKSVKFDYKMFNSELQPVIKDVDDFKFYTWESKSIQATKDESFMPLLSDVGTNLHISTIKSWNDVAQWYSDISYSRIEDEYELKEVYTELFPNANEKLSGVDKAKRIYNYIEKNFRYSSVPFRQTAYVPQKASVTINTRLGDCKDLSSLFVSLASMAGLKANLVLVETKNNGLKEMILPSVEFNHCIVLLKADGKEYYLELTDNNLPFGSLPNDVIGASSLIIPSQTEKDLVSNLQPIAGNNRTAEKIKRTVNINLNGNDLNMQVEVQKTGALTSGVRSDYNKLSKEKQKEEMEKAVSGSFKNPVKLESVSFTGLEDLIDSVKYNFKYTVKNEVIEVGAMKMFKLPFGDIIATIDNFSLDARKFPIEYWQYENVDQYETIINIKVPAGKKIVEVPKDQTFAFKKINYSIKYIKTGTDKLTIIRKATIDRKNIEASDYPAFKDFFNNIVQAESKYIAFN